MEGNSAGPGGNSIRFDLLDWQVQPDLNRVIHDNEFRALEPRVMQVLVYLAQHADRGVSRQELHEAIWGDVYVMEGALTRAISQLRTALGDDSRQPRYIETIRKGGYRLIAPVSWEQPAAQVAPEPIATAPAAPPPTTPPRTVSRRGMLWLLVVPVLVAAWFWWPQSETPVSVENATDPVTVPLTSFKGAEKFPSYSPDGTRVAFVWAEPGLGSDDIYVKTVDG